MKTKPKTQVACQVCHKAPAVSTIKDCGFSAYPACKTCTQFMLTQGTARVVK